MIVSAGFDAHARDPLADMLVTERGFAAMCTSLAELARSHCGGKLVLLLEGGYHLEALAQSVRACLEVMTGARREDFPRRRRPRRAGRRRRQRARRCGGPVAAARAATWIDEARAAPRGRLGAIRARASAISIVSCWR